MLLDVDHGTYPFVTSSNTVSGTAASGSGLGPRATGFVLGIVKAYTTRVGAGPFPTELEDDVGQRLGERGHEFGTVTGRKRRCGWFDAVLVRQSCAISGITGIALTKIDVLDGFDTVQVCTGYRLGDEVLDYFPSHAADQAAVEPIYEEMQGWSGTTVGARSWADLPARGDQIYPARAGTDRNAGRSGLDEPGARGYHPRQGSVRGLKICCGLH